jgi:hypothetical protein
MSGVVDLWNIVPALADVCTRHAEHWKIRRVAAKLCFLRPGLRTLETIGPTHRNKCCLTLLLGPELRVKLSTAHLLRESHRIACHRLLPASDAFLNRISGLRQYGGYAWVIRLCIDGVELTELPRRA